MLKSRFPAVQAILLIALATLMASMLTGCDAVQRGFPVAIFRPSSPETAAIHNLSLIILAIAAVAFVIVEVWLFLAALRFRNRSEEQAVQTHGNLRLETGWTLVTGLVVFVVLALTIKTMVDVTVPPDPQPTASGVPGDVLELRVVAHQFWWEFEYPQYGIVTASEAHVPAGVPVRVQLESADVIHAFWVPRLGGKIDAIPGQVNYTSFTATEPGVYHGLCAEFCGDQHAHMGFRIVVEPAGSSFSPGDPRSVSGHESASHEVHAHSHQESHDHHHIVAGH